MRAHDYFPNRIHMKYLIFLLVAFSVTLVELYPQQPVTITISANKPVSDVSPTMWGIFFEDINFAADGGIYAELVKNRSFEFYNPMTGWKELSKKGKFQIISQADVKPENPRFVRLFVDAGSDFYGLSNEGFRGMGVTQGETYNFSMFARKAGEGNVSLKIQLISSSGEVIGNTEINDFTTTWKKHKVSFGCSATDANAKLNILFTGKGILDIDMVSLFPQHTWNNRENGLRKDLVQMLYDLKPGFIRFPGGCIVEGHELANRYQWKKTVGNIENRELIINRWNTEFRDKLTPDYFQSFGLGFFEYFQLAEDIGAEPLPILNCGMACQYNTAELVPLDKIDPYIQDALDLIEFANGAVTTPWGKLRADMGHPAPFHLKYLGIGNEQWDEQYIERYTLFTKVLKGKHPEIKLVSSAGPSPDGQRFEYAWTELRKLNADLIDEHYYQSPEWFLKNASRYDNYDPKGPKVFAGEYAAHPKANDQPESRNTWEGALAEAAFMTGLERNAAVVRMASYAPLFGNVNAWQWRPDLIWFDNLRTVGTPNYYVQKLFSTNKGTHVVPALKDGKPLEGADSLYVSATIDIITNTVCVKIVNASSKLINVNLALSGASPLKNTLEVVCLNAENMNFCNTLDNPKLVYPATNVLDASNIKRNSNLYPVKSKSLNVIKIVCNKLILK